ncbi:MAG: hypothetical protein ACREDV_00590, partial [Methylocella sp.]
MAWLAWIEFGFSSDGIADLIGEGIGSFLIPALIAAAFTWRKKSKLGYIVALAVSAAVLVQSHWDGMVEGYDAREFMADMAKATPDNYADIPKNSKTHLGQALNAMLVVTQKRGNAIGVLFQDIDDQQFNDMLA